MISTVWLLCVSVTNTTNAKLWVSAVEYAPFDNTNKFVFTSVQPYINCSYSHMSLYIILCPKMQHTAGHVEPVVWADKIKETITQEPVWQIFGFLSLCVLDYLKFWFDLVMSEGAVDYIT